MGHPMRVARHHSAKPFDEASVAKSDFRAFAQACALCVMQCQPSTRRAQGKAPTPQNTFQLRPRCCCSNVRSEEPLQARDERLIRAIARLRPRPADLLIQRIPHKLTKRDVFLTRQTTRIRQQGIRHADHDLFK